MGDKMPSCQESRTGVTHPDRIDACKPRRVTIAGLLTIRPMTENPENPSQDILQARVKRDPAIGFVIFPGLATLLQP